MYTVKTPKVVKALYSDLIWHMPRTEKVIYLTFDDGPIPEVTPFVLDSLQHFNAKATFFCIGENIDKYPQIFEHVQAAGHSLGNHSQNHLNGWKSSRKDYLQNIELCQQRIQTKLFRPPYGKIKRVQAKALRSSFKIIMWDVLSGDFDTRISPEKCLRNVIQHTTSGSIVVFHDSLKAKRNMEYALPRTLQHFTEAGYRFEKL